MTTAWAVVYIGDDGRRIIASNTIRRTRRESIEAAITWLDQRDDWNVVRREWRRHRRAGRVACVRVEVREAGE